jgi:tRNA (cmo5U34)-methyltransferase
MLDVCREKLRSAGVLNRTELIQGYVNDVPQTESFDAALSILVAHFLKREERLNFYQAICARLSKNSILINAEISYDLNSPQFTSMVKNWEAVQLLMGATPESLADMPRVLREMLSVITPGETENLLIQSGISMPVRFFQAFMISGWYGRKDS